jgi:hypothetical protein
MANSPLERLWYGQCPHISQQKNYFVPCNMWNSIQYEKACSLTLNYYTLFIWTNMVLLVHKKSKSIDEFIRFCIELGEF